MDSFILRRGKLADPGGSGVSLEESKSDAAKKVNSGVEKNFLVWGREKFQVEGETSDRETTREKGYQSIQSPLPPKTLRLSYARGRIAEGGGLKQLCKRESRTYQTTPIIERRSTNGNWHGSLSS